MGKIELKKKQKKDALFNTAFDLFTTKGIAKTTISDIVEKAGVAKGTFYLYFKDKYDIKNKLISHKASLLFQDAHKALQQTKVSNFEEQIIFIIDHILNALSQNPALLQFIAKNLSWGIFREAFDSKVPQEDYDFYQAFLGMLKTDSLTCQEPELMLFTIVELVGSTCYNCILHQKPVDLETYKPHLYHTVRDILHSYLTPA
ncbi:MAG: TetR/AcrR family transcriptional regulator [Blautia sp.]|jgi:AcrR family transcriptional regulator